MELARDESCVQNVDLSTGSLTFIHSAMRPRASVQGLCSVTFSPESGESAKMDRET